MNASSECFMIPFFPPSPPVTLSLLQRAGLLGGRKEKNNIGFQAYSINNRRMIVRKNLHLRGLFLYLWKYIIKLKLNDICSEDIIVSFLSIE